MSYSSEVLADSPAGWWRLGEASGATCADSSGNSHPATCSGTVTRGVASLLAADSDLATSFGTNPAGFDKAQTAPAFSGNRTAITFEAWIKTTATATRSIFSADGAGSTRLFQYRLNNGKLELILFDTGGNAQVVTGTVTVNDGSAHHVVATYDGSHVTFYIDGVQSGTPSALSITLANVSQAIALGGSPGATTGSLGGTLDEPAIYYSTLSATRVLAHYNAGTGQTTVTGAASLTVTDTITTAGRADHFGAASLTVTDTITTSGHGNTLDGAATFDIAAAFTTAGTVAQTVTGSATLDLTATFTTAAAETHTGACTLTITCTTGSDGGQPAMGVAVTFGQNALTAVPTWTRLDGPA